MSNSALVHKYSDGTTGWVLAWGLTVNLEIDDPSTQVLVALEDGSVPDGSKPLWKQRIDVEAPLAGVFAPYTDEDKDAVRVWLASQFVSRKTMLHVPAPIVILDTAEIELGCWVQDARNQSESEESESRVFGVIFAYENPVEIRPPVIVIRGYNAGGVEKHALVTAGEAIKSSNDPTTSFEFWKMAIWKNVPDKFREWRAFLSVPTLAGSETCTVKCLRVRTGARGAV